MHGQMRQIGQDASHIAAERVVKKDVCAVACERDPVRARHGVLIQIHNRVFWLLRLSEIVRNAIGCKYTSPPIPKIQLSHIIQILLICIRVP